ncbi:MAG: selenocysteine-specific translation elongation factor [Gemmatimonadetes bacterium]|nr:selenocysteine-specific translation elongation factor [Gemmatimonadota bacterium]
MGRHVVIGTAGHVDHGKTALVKALTGIDTDRWEEEKRRGITIDLGFAHFELNDECTASVVDVPGHEDFVRNMVAGATGIDVALLVVAADEGIMPQTVEHLAILGFLGVPTGVVAVTKTDLVEAEWLELVIDDVTQRLDGTAIAWEAPCGVSVRSGEGIDDLRDAIAAAAARAVERTADDLFRMPVDRSFSVAGAGTVVTGTTWAGTIARGDEVRVLPGEHTSRVRGVEVHGVAVPRADPGRRTALALVGLNRAEGRRGSTIVSHRAWRATRAVDVRVTLLPEARPITQRSRIRVHVGTVEVMARMTPAAEEIPPGGSGVVRLRLEAPLVCRWGDRGVLRSYSPVTTVGGFIVVDPWPAPRPRRPRERPDRWSLDPVERVAAFVSSEEPGSVAVADLAVRLGIAPGSVDEVAAGVASAGGEVVGGRFYPGASLAGAAAAALAAVAKFHEEQPLQPGMAMAAFRRSAGGAGVADHVRSRLESEGKIEVEGGVVRLPGFEATLSGTRAQHGVVLEKRLKDAGAHGVTMSDVSDAVPAELAEELAEFLVRRGTAVRVGQERYYDPAALTEVAGKAVAAIERLGEVTPADLREALGLSRKYLIPLLEWLDARGITVRVGDVRRLGPKAHQLS